MRRLDGTRFCVGRGWEGKAKKVRFDVRADRVVTVAGRQVTFFVEVANALNREAARALQLPPRIHRL